ncbi:MAG: MmcQ/YjbR family DNA-binding protein [Cytophagales bacterium]|nr:MmcQ/YjbR family DNA-binding protein [Cytophagales bacterium]
MNIESFRTYCLSKKGVTEEFPFDDVTLVFKVMGKMFALADVDLFKSINLKCDPERAVELRDEYPAINAGYHMNKRHWNTIEMDGTLSDVFVKELIDHSYDLVVAKLSKAQKARLEQIN